MRIAADWHKARRCRGRGELKLTPLKKIAIWLFLVIAIYCSAVYLLVFNGEDSCDGNCVRGNISRLENFHTGTIYVEFFGDEDFLKDVGTKKEIADKFLRALQLRATKYFPQEKLVFKLNDEGSSFVAHPLDLGINLNFGAATHKRIVFTAQISRSEYFDYYQNFLSSQERGERDISLTPPIARKFLKGKNSLNFLTKTIEFETSDIRKNGSIPIEQMADWVSENMKPHADESRQAEKHLKATAGLE